MDIESKNMTDVRRWGQGVRKIGPKIGEWLCGIGAKIGEWLCGIGAKIGEWLCGIDAKIGIGAKIGEWLCGIGAKIGEWLRGIGAKIGEWLREIGAKIRSSFFHALEVICQDPAKLIEYIVVCIVGVCVDPFFLYVPFLSHTKMCLGMNTELWKVAVALRSVADFFTILILLPRLSDSSCSILLTCVKFLVLAPISQNLFSEELILKTLGVYTFWNLILLCQCGVRLVLICQSCKQLKTMVSSGTSSGTFVWFIATVYFFLFLIVSHLIGASWYYLSIKQQLSCWNHACKFDTGRVHNVFHCDGTTTSPLNSTLVNEFCPLNSQKFGIYLDALQSGIVEDKGVLKKFLRSFSWGLRNLGSWASNLDPSTNEGETLFAIIIAVLGLVLMIIMPAWMLHGIGI